MCVCSLRVSHMIATTTTGEGGRNYNYNNYGEWSEARCVLFAQEQLNIFMATRNRNRLWYFNSTDKLSWQRNWNWN